MKKTGQPYATWKDDGKYDVIVIGKHADRRVLVLERHTTAGGFTHTFSRKGWDWDVGVHYIGEVSTTSARSIARAR